MSPAWGWMSDFMMSIHFCLSLYIYPLPVAFSHHPRRSPLHANPAREDRVPALLGMVRLEDRILTVMPVQRADERILARLELGRVLRPQEVRR